MHYHAERGNEIKTSFQSVNDTFLEMRLIHESIN